MKVSYIFSWEKTQLGASIKGTAEGKTYLLYQVLLSLMPLHSIKKYTLIKMANLNGILLNTTMLPLLAISL